MHASSRRASAKRNRDGSIETIRLPVEAAKLLIRPPMT
jgi:hypothetical protein